MDKHSGVTPELEAFIYDVKGLVKQLLNKEINVEQAVSRVHSLFKEKTAQLSNLGNQYPTFSVGRRVLQPPVFLLHRSEYDLSHNMGRLSLYVCIGYREAYRVCPREQNRTTMYDILVGTTGYLVRQCQRIE